MSATALVLACSVAALLALAIGLALGWAAARVPPATNRLVEQIDALLPQTQCGRCKYPACRPYAQAIAQGDAEINRCLPGGEATILALARLLDRAPRPLDPSLGPPPQPAVAWIDEDRCIGCARCLAPCPVDAIVGARRHRHTVLADRCTGCELCLPPCPVDCIEMRPVPASTGYVWHPAA